MADHNGIPRIYFKGTAPNAEGSNFWVRQLYFQAKPVDGVEFQYGSLPINKGVNTEVTSYDDDGYVAGARLSLKMPKRLFFDEISYTHAYLGDIVTPNFFRRYDRLTTSNYRQFLVAKNVGTRAQVSGDFTYHDSVKTLREAVKVNTKEAKVVDNVRFETYQRLNDFTYFNAAANANDGGGAGLGILGRGREGDPQARHARRRLQQD
jgi:hypothetical protein